MENIMVVSMDIEANHDQSKGPFIFKILKT